MKKIFTFAAIMALTMPVLKADDYFDDDIYYNPSKDKNSSKGQSSYISDFANVDVDEYNRRGQYYLSPIDTIGERVSNDEDFRYTQQIQKFYNPTIVVDNAGVLQDVLANSYGNVDIVIDNGYVAFAPWYGGYSTWPYYSSWGSPYFSFTWGWGGGWYDPWAPVWGWGPSWSWSWGWGPGWGPAWGWGPGPIWGPGPAISHRPAGNHRDRVGPQGGWATATRPGYGRPASGRIPQNGMSRPATSMGGSHRQYGVGVSGSGVTNGTGSHRSSGISIGTNNTSTRGSYNNNNNSYNNRTNSNSNRSYNSGRSTSGRSTGGGFGGGSSRGGGGGSHRGGGGRR